jgi:hypothetical protein
MSNLTGNAAYVQYESQSTSDIRETTGVYFQNNRQYTVWQYRFLFDVTADGTAYCYSEVLNS